MMTHFLWWFKAEYNVYELQYIFPLITITENIGVYSFQMTQGGLVSTTGFLSLNKNSLKQILKRNFIHTKEHRG